MHELAKVTLQNEMDLVLAHKRSMKLAELAGLTLAAQTTFATAVSEVSRTAINTGISGCLTLCVEPGVRLKYIVASITHEVVNANGKAAGLEYASKLVDKYEVCKTGKESKIDLYYTIPSQNLDLPRVDEWRNLFRNEPPVSAYDEIKRKNEQLQDMAEKVKVSESQYKKLTNTLPLMIFSMDADHQVTYGNEWLFAYTGLSIAQLNASSLKSIIHQADYVAFENFLTGRENQHAATETIQCRIRHHHTGQYLWHLVSITPLGNAENSNISWIGFMADINTQKVYEETLQSNRELKEKQTVLKQNIQELNRSNVELQLFAYIASHDLQEPVRKLIFYSDYLSGKYGAQLDDKGMRYLHNINNSSVRMRDLIRDLLTFSQVNQKEHRFEKVNLNIIMHETLQDLELAVKEKSGVVTYETLPTIVGDAVLLRQLFANLISNSIKYAQKNIPPLVHVTVNITAGEAVIAFADNGIGFDQKYSDKLFTLFQRLHNREHYAGTGLGLAICRKIAEAHGGSIAASGKPGEGAVFVVTLPLEAVKMPQHAQV